MHVFFLLRLLIFLLQLFVLFLFLQWKITIWNLILSWTRMGLPVKQGCWRLFLMEWVWTWDIFLGEDLHKQQPLLQKVRLPPVLAQEHLHQMAFHQIPDIRNGKSLVSIITVETMYIITPYVSLLPCDTDVMLMQLLRSVLIKLDHEKLFLHSLSHSSNCY